jgi:creatinine amidohydrolase/Fe(II)-dependent formamide hydrolase-like protein
MLYPGTISVSEQTFQTLLTDICASLKAHGFRRIVLIGDSGGNQAGMKAVAEKLDAKWKGASRVVFIPEYYDSGPLTKWLESQGIKQTPEGLHDDFAMEATMLAINPESVRMKQRIAAGNFRINGIDLAPADKTIAWGKRIIDFRAEATVKAIRQALTK